MPGESQDQRDWQATVRSVAKESDMTKATYAYTVPITMTLGVHGHDCAPRKYVSKAKLNITRFHKMLVAPWVPPDETGKCEKVNVKEAVALRDCLTYLTFANLQNCTNLCGGPFQCFTVNLPLGRIVTEGLNIIA